jgi:hypothetical protein
MPKRFETNVVGMQHRLTMSTRRLMVGYLRKCDRIGVMLIREPDNNADENAIKVVIRDTPYKGMHIGYLPKTVASVYAPALDEMLIQVIDSWVWEVNPDEGTASLVIRFGKHGKVKPKRKTPVSKPVKKKSRKGA